MDAKFRAQANGDDDVYLELWKQHDICECNDVHSASREDFGMSRDGKKEVQPWETFDYFCMFMRLRHCFRIPYNLGWRPTEGEWTCPPRPVVRKEKENRRSGWWTYTFVDGAPPVMCPP